MKIAVVTPYYNESIEVLRKCHESVLAQTHGDVLHIMVADGNPRDEIDTWNVKHIKLPRHNDYGDTPRVIGAFSAATYMADGITLLDADNYFAPEHIETLFKIQQANNVQIVTGKRWVVDPNYNMLGVCPESDGENFCDTNCILVMRDSFRLFEAWGLKDPKYGIIGDRYFWNACRNSGLPRAHCDVPTVYYVSTFAFHYQTFGLPVPDFAKIIVRFAGNDVYKMMNYNNEYLPMVEAQKKALDS